MYDDTLQVKVAVLGNYTGRNNEGFLAPELYKETLIMDGNDHPPGPEWSEEQHEVPSERKVEGGANRAFGHGRKR